jgi:hypothetical protein
MNLKMLFRRGSRGALIGLVVALTVGLSLVAATPTAVKAQTCFACYPGGFGNPEICSAGQHFDQTGGSSFFTGAMHDGCAANDNCGEVHDRCISHLDVAGLERAIRERNVDAIRWYLWSTTQLELSKARATIRVTDCRGETTKEIQIPRRLLARVVT